MDTTNDQRKKCFCARCFLPIEAEDKVDIEGQNFHRPCCICCLCRSLPTSLKMFYGHVFCNDCFKTHVLTRFRCESTRMHSNSWWMQWAPGTRPEQNRENKDNNEEDNKKQDAPEENQRRCFCARCLLPVDDNKVDVGGQSFHPQCARCYCCQCVPTNNLKIYYGQVFCEECFNRHVLNQNHDNPNEFFRNCFEQWQNNGHFAEQMKNFMGENKANSPFIYMMQGQGSQPPFCRCGTGPRDWFQNNEPKKSETLVNVSTEDDMVNTCDQSFENQTELSDIPESCQTFKESVNQENFLVGAAEKIEKLTKYLQDKLNTEKHSKKWKNFIENCNDSPESMETYYCSWVDLQEPKNRNSDLIICPKCLWQSGIIYVNSENIQEQQCFGKI